MKLLFICTHNRCRSILAEAITNHLGCGQLLAKSAGSQPVGEVHPLSLKYLAEANISTAGLSSQSWDEHESWQPDIVITVCDAAAGEACPVWFGQSIKVHWGLTDPSSVDGSEQEIADAFRQTIATLHTRIETLLGHNLDRMDQQQLSAVFNALGEN
ncbi:arsenate reductase ArsC [Oceanicoccus sagamiensis]|uniref:Low molecular weight phosphatase family protein n=1 Tax=Oceanicoccus sagamiensis TaxID=716816 RepID=A0A1X9NGP3_9GAMM|nr:arsenate reductase ArsC [Oceanicoccus sagamiensis]ARN74117.1 low molecular weight phosphatase family protein [Oceanicoccus sagamiensis]